MLEDESGALVKPEILGEELIDDIHHSLKIIESRTQGLINFVKATKSLTQIPNPTIRTIGVRELLDRIDILFHTRYKDAGVACEKQIIPPDLSVEADLELIEQVMINLVQNCTGSHAWNVRPQALHNCNQERIITCSDLCFG